MRLLEKGKELLKRAAKNERGEINISGLMMMGIGMVFIAVGFIIYPVVTTAATTILGYEYSANTAITDATFTGLTSVTGIVPLVVLVGFLVAGVITSFMGYKAFKGATSVGPTGIMMLGIGIIFIAVGLIIFPVVLDGAASVLHGGGEGISSSFTGLSSIILVSPLIVMTAFLAGGIVTGFFGVQTMKGNMG